MRTVPASLGPRSQLRRKNDQSCCRSGLSRLPVFDWYGQNSARKQAEKMITALQDRIVRLVTAKGKRCLDTIPDDDLARARDELAATGERVAALMALYVHCLDWDRKANREWSKLPTFPLVVHGRPPIAAILGNLEPHMSDGQCVMVADKLVFDCGSDLIAEMLLSEVKA